VIEKMLAFDPDLLVELEQPAFVIARNKNKATNVPIICSSPDRKRWYFRYREDVLACLHLASSLERFTDRYINNPDCWTAEFRLEKNQILVVDNHRMLHMRRSFQIADGQPPRLLRRTWINNEQWSSDIKLKSTSRHDAFEDSVGYTPVHHHVSNRLIYASGIRKSEFTSRARIWSKFPGTIGFSRIGNRRTVLARPRPAFDSLGKQHSLITIRGYRGRNLKTAMARAASPVCVRRYQKLAFHSICCVRASR